MQIRRTAAVLTSCAALTLSGVAVAAPASAAPQQRGLVNVNIDDTTIQVPIAVAANLCDINVNVLALQLRNGQTECDAQADSGAEN